MKAVLSKVVMMFHQAGMLDIKELYTDATKIETNANKYSFVWGKSIQSRKEKILVQLKELWDYAIKVSQEELTDLRPQSFEEVNLESVSQTIEEINKALEKK